MHLQVENTLRLGVCTDAICELAALVLDGCVLFHAARQNFAGDRLQTRVSEEGSEGW